MNTFQEDTITLRKRELKVKTGYLPHAGLLFYAENPRIYSMVWKDNDSEPTQEEIFDALSKSEHVRETLIPSIRSNGGLIEPVLVRKGVVLEGNSRLAAYRVLAQKDAKTWEHIRVRILPDSVTDSEVFSLLGEFHIVGKKDWAPFEQAGYLFRRFTTHGVDEDQLHAEVGLSKTKIRHLIRVYGFMIEVDDRNPARWSYYDELLKGRRFNHARELYPDFDEKIAEMIQDESIERAVDVRDGLPMVAKAGGNTLKRFMNGSLSFHDAVEDARLRGAGNYYSKKFSDFRKWLADDHIDTEVTNIPIEEKKALSYELSRIEARIKQIAKKVNGQAAPDTATPNPKHQASVHSKAARVAMSDSVQVRKAAAIISNQGITAKSDWVTKSVRFPAGTDFRSTHKGEIHTARVEGGALVRSNGERYKSASAAAVSITGTSVNGWTFWECKLPGQATWKRIDALRT